MSVKLIHYYRENAEYRQAFFELVPQIFTGVSFTEWYKRGCWDPKYQGYAMYDETTRQMIANVSICPMDIWLNHRLIQGVQFSAVSSLPQARGKGYHRKLMEAVFKDYAHQTDLFFLFANPSVTDFYPLFGFRQVKEHLFHAAYPSNLSPGFSAVHLDVDQPDDWQLLTSFTANRTPITQVFGAANDGYILGWGLLYPFRQKILYLPQQQVIVIAETKEGVLYIYDILTQKPLSEINFDEVLELVSLPGTHTIELHFTPEKLPLTATPIATNGNSPLFVKGDFPIASHHFKFPVMAQT
ncbi:GNAT family N-acetyltransferase [uncultured Microscilla sp.]|uniref:GNAT family N-acetyltransferase n=1 Tax=uncultured Microscilla sp. TaxID=432653 RepID=UPI002618DC0F|nr:GNAT family N-acetyltransferase [uncultured Microscilla sp.]